jgi:hypothetical protein
MLVDTLSVFLRRKDEVQVLHMDGMLSENPLQEYGYRNAGRCSGARLWCACSLAQDTVLVAKVESTSFGSVRGLKAARNSAGFQCTLMSQLVS